MLRLFIYFNLNSDGISWNTLEEICQNNKMENLFLAEMQKHCLKCRLEKFEIPQALKLVPEVWTPDMVHIYFVPL